jgi:hypothetical protein
VYWLIELTRNICVIHLLTRAVGKLERSEKKLNEPYNSNLSDCTK